MRSRVLSLLCGVFSLTLVACHDVGDVKVLSLAFEGVQAFDEAELHRVLATRESGWLPWSTKRYFDRAEFEADLKRVQAFYADRGFPHVRLLGVDVVFNQAKDGVKLRIRIDEGAPVIVEAVRFEGFDVLPDDARNLLASLPLQAGGRRDRDVVRVTKDRASRLFRDRGYPLAVVDAGERPGATADSVIVSFRADPGPAMTFGEITVAGVETLEDRIVRRELAFSPGQVYDERLVARSQRRLAGLDLLELAVVTPRTDAPDGASVPVRVTVAEGKPRRLMLGAGYGTEERLRGTVSWQHLNFFGGAERATFDAKWSAIDRGARLELMTPYLGRPGLSMTASAGAWWTEQLTYDSDTAGGRLALVYDADRSNSSGRPPVRYRTSLTYAVDRLRYGIKPEFLADQSRRDERIALGLDPETGRASGTLAVVAMDVERVALNNAADPRLGATMAGHVEVASPALGGSYRFVEVGGEVRGFVPVGAVVLAGRVRAGTIASSDPLSVPFAKRYFLGGSSNLRGWSRFQVSPLDADGRPIGGRSVFDTSVEARIPLPGSRPIALVLFADGGNVWADDWTVDVRDLRWAAGAGLRYFTPIGALRLDLAKQLTPIGGLVINGKPSSRTWRVHFNIGHSFQP